MAPFLRYQFVRRRSVAVSEQRGDDEMKILANEFDFHLLFALAILLVYMATMGIIFLV